MNTLRHILPAIDLSARGIDLVVVGTQGVAVLRGGLFGSVTQRMLADVPVDLLVVPPGDDAKTSSAPP